MWEWLLTKWGKASYFAALVAFAALGGVLFGWGDGIVIGAGSFNVLLGVVALIGIFMHKPKGDGDAAKTDANEPDWLSLGVVEVRVTGSSKRYLARFSNIEPPIDAMSRDERRIAETLVFLGMPRATVRLKERDSAVGGDEIGDVQVVEIHPMLVRDAGRVRRRIDR